VLSNVVRERECVWVSERERETDRRTDRQTLTGRQKARARARESARTHTRGGAGGGGQARRTTVTVLPSAPLTSVTPIVSISMVGKASADLICQGQIQLVGKARNPWKIGQEHVQHE